MAGAEAGTIALAAGDYTLALDPARGGSVARFDWRGKPLFRPSSGAGIFDVACFVMVPFSNRIAHGMVRHPARTVRLAPNMPGTDHPHPMHGYGWLNAWDVIAAGTGSARLRYRHDADEWPWGFVADQDFELTDAGLVHRLSLRNLADEPMPGGLGYHPYFPCNAQTRYHGLHRGEWQVDGECLPLSLTEGEAPRDWWHGAPVATRAVDTAYTDRFGPLFITWPDRAMVLVIEPSPALPHTVVYSPAGADHVCVEPVSHTTDAINRPRPGDAMAWLPPGAALTAEVRYRAQELATRSDEKRPWDGTRTER